MKLKKLWWINCVISLLGVAVMILLMCFETTKEYCWIPLIISLFAYANSKLIEDIYDLYGENENEIHKN